MAARTLRIAPSRSLPRPAHFRDHVDDPPSSRRQISAGARDVARLGAAAPVRVTLRSRSRGGIKHQPSAIWARSSAISSPHSFGNPQRFRGFPHRVIVGQQRPGNMPQAVSDVISTGSDTRVGVRALHGDAAVACRRASPGRPRLHPASPRVEQRQSPAANRNEVCPSTGSPSARSMTLCANRMPRQLHRRSQSSRTIAAKDSRPPVSASGRRSTRAGPWTVRRPARDASRWPMFMRAVLPPARPSRWPATLCRQRRRTTLASSSKPVPATPSPDTPGGPTQHRARGDAHRRAVRIVGGQRVGDLAGALPTASAPQRCRGWSTMFRRACASRRRRADRLRPPVFGDQRGVFVDRSPGRVLRSRRPAAGAARRGPT